MTDSIAFGGLQYNRQGTRVVPSVSAITPSSGSTVGGTVITNLAGTNFVSGVGLRVTFDGVAATGVVWISSTELECVAPAGSAGPADIVVTNPGAQTSGTSGNGLFTYT